MSALPQTTPAWTALTAYLVGARVAKVATDGTNWYATVAGTSGAVEPTWPSSEPWTVVDGTVTWRLATSFRQLMRAGLLSTLTAFQSANPWALKGIAAARPANLAKLDLPGAYIGDMGETVSHTQGVRTRVFTGLSVVLVLPVPDNAESIHAADTIVDALTDAFTAAFHAADGSSNLQETSVVEIPLETDGGYYLGNLFTFGVSSKAEGRN